MSNDLNSGKSRIDLLKLFSALWLKRKSKIVDVLKSVAHFFGLNFISPAGIASTWSKSIVKSNLPAAFSLQLSMFNDV